MDDALYTGDLDLSSVNTCTDLAVLLRTVHIRADKPSLRTLEARTRHSPIPLSKTTTAEMLKGVRLPRKAVMLAFLQACGVPEDGMESWQRTWERVASNEEASVQPKPVQVASDLQDYAAVAVPHHLSITRDAALVQEARRIDANVMTGSMPASVEPAGMRQLREQVDQLTSDNERLRTQLAAIGGQAGDELPQGDSDSSQRERNPALCRRELSTLLRVLRVEMGITVGQVAEHLMCSQTKVRRMEHNFRSGTLRDVRDLCDLYGVTDTAKRNHLMKLAREGKRQSWQQPYPLGLSTYFELEAGATSIKTYESVILPGFVQTADYAREVFESYTARIGSEVIEQRIEGRLARQRRFIEADPPRAWLIIEEAVLHRVVGSPMVMMAQLDRLIEVAELPNVKIQIIPYGLGVRQAIDSNFIILEFAANVDSVVYVEGLVSDLFLERSRDVEQYQFVFGKLCSIALEEPESIAKIVEIDRGFRAD